ncbi:MAG: poly-beta-1,6-N-acetyl-D-glucosamine N-deacetylase PgaB [Candidatus Odinarchaeia archaeon]
MDIREKLSKDVNLILDPVSLNMSPSQFIADYGGNIDKISILVKHTTGHVFYESKVAPLHPDIGKFFSKFTEISEGLIDVYAVVNTLVDFYMAEDIKYASVKSGGRKSSTHICPTKDETVNYLGEIVKEIVKYPIKGVIFTGNAFINRYYCFCNNCRQEFSVVSHLPDEYDYNRIKLSGDLEEKWTKWKSDKILSMITYLADIVKQENDKIETAFEVYIDPSVNYRAMSEIEYGQDIIEISDKYNVILNIYPWSPILPENNTPEYKELIDALSFTNELKRKGREFHIMYWSIDNDEDYSILNSIKNEINAKNIYVYNDYPPNYTDMRETHLGR